MSLQKVKINLWNPHSNQKRILEDGNRFKVIVCGRRFGKTTLAVNLLVKQALLNPNGHYFYVAPTYKQAKMIAWEMLLDTCQKLPRELVARKHESELYVVLGNNSRIDIKGADNPDSLRGVGLNGIVLDEYADIKQNLFEEIIRPALTDKKGWAIFIGTPRGFNHFYDLYDKAGELDNWSRYKFTSYDNPLLDPEEIEQAKQQSTDDKFAQEYLADFRKFEGLVYDLHNWHVVNEVPDRADITLGGIDWGYTNPAALTIIKLTDGKFYIVDEWYESGKTTPEIIEQCQKLQKKWGVNRWYADSANPEKVGEASRGSGLYIIPYEKQKDSLTAGISYVQQLFKENRLFVHENCINSINEFNSYHYKEVDKKTKHEEPEKEDDHLMDAIRYTIHGYAPAARIPTAPKSFFTQINKRNNAESTKQTSYK